MTNHRDVLSRRKPASDFKLPGDSKATKEAISEAQRYLEALEKQLQATFEL